jgi:hypothetical protein
MTNPFTAASQQTTNTKAGKSLGERVFDRKAAKQDKIKSGAILSDKVAAAKEQK